MKWFIHLDNLRTTLPYREHLNWKKINLFTFSRHRTILDENIFHEMSKVTYPIKSFSVYVENLTDAGLKNLCAMGSALECLHLQYEYRLRTF